jgi:hypothetical protein
MTSCSSLPCPSLALPSDSVARYLFKNHFNKNRVDYSAFMPPRSYPNELSVCVTTSLSDAQIWQYAPPPRNGDECKARADFNVGHLIQEVQNETAILLSVVADGNPHPYHANIKTPPVEKPLQKRIALILARLSEVHFKPYSQDP